jgi:hypothetical protein
MRLHRFIFPFGVLIYTLSAIGCSFESRYGTAQLKAGTDEDISLQFHAQNLDTPAKSTLFSKGPKVVTIDNERGGFVVDYAMRMVELRESKTEVRFTGRCDSACTLYLALPRSQVCIAAGASFGFHKPRASTGHVTRAAEAYMLKTYPDWVNAWIQSRGGLSHRTMTMGYSFASKHMRPCEAISMERNRLTVRPSHRRQPVETDS